jgi:hypothetical protein
MLDAAYGIQALSRQNAAGEVDRGVIEQLVHDLESTFDRMVEEDDRSQS